MGMYASKIGPLTAKREYLRHFSIMSEGRSIGRIFGDSGKTWCAGFHPSKGASGFTEGLTSRVAAIDWLVQSAAKRGFKVVDGKVTTAKAKSEGKPKAKKAKPEGEAKGKAKKAKPSPKAQKAKAALDQGDEAALAQLLGLAEQAEQPAAE